MIGDDMEVIAQKAPTVAVETSPTTPAELHKLVRPEGLRKSTIAEPGPDFTPKTEVVMEDAIEEELISDAQMDLLLRVVWESERITCQLPPPPLYAAVSARTWLTQFSGPFFSVGVEKKDGSVGGCHRVTFSWTQAGLIFLQSLNHPIFNAVLEKNIANRKRYRGKQLRHVQFPMPNDSPTEISKKIKVISHVFMIVRNFCSYMDLFLARPPADIIAELDINAAALMMALDSTNSHSEVNFFIALFYNAAGIAADSEHAAIGAGGAGAPPGGGEGGSTGEGQRGQGGGAARGGDPGGYAGAPDAGAGGMGGGPMGGGGGLMAGGDGGGDSPGGGGGGNTSDDSSEGSSDEEDDEAQSRRQIDDMREAIARALAPLRAEVVRATDDHISRLQQRMRSYRVSERNDEAFSRTVHQWVAESERAILVTSRSMLTLRPVVCQQTSRLSAAATAELSQLLTRRPLAVAKRSREELEGSNSSHGSSCVWPEAYVAPPSTYFNMSLTPGEGGRDEIKLRWSPEGVRKLCASGGCLASRIGRECRDAILYPERLLRQINKSDEAACREAFTYCRDLSLFLDWFVSQSLLDIVDALHVRIYLVNEAIFEELRQNPESQTVSIAVFVMLFEKCSRVAHRKRSSGVSVVEVEDVCTCSREFGMGIVEDEQKFEAGRVLRSYSDFTPPADLWSRFIPFLLGPARSEQTPPLTDESKPSSSSSGGWKETFTKNCAAFRYCPDRNGCLVDTGEAVWTRPIDIKRAGSV